MASILPSVLFIGYAIGHVRPDAWTDTTGVFNCTKHADNGSVIPSDDDAWLPNDEGVCRVPVNWGTLLSYAMWFVGIGCDSVCMLKYLLLRMYCGVYNTGTLAEQVDKPRSTFPKVRSVTSYYTIPYHTTHSPQAMFIFLPLVFIQTVLPLALSISIDTNLATYDPGKFSEIGKVIAGEWLDLTISIGAIIAQIGQTNGASLIADESLQSYALVHHSEFFRRKAKSQSALTRWLFDTDFRVAPVFVIFDGVLLAGLVFAPYDLLITASMLIMNVTICLFLGSTVILKHRHPDYGWPYIKTWKWAVVICLPPALGSLVMSFFTIYDDYSLYGIPSINLVSFACVIALGLVLHGAFELAVRRMRRSSVDLSADDETINLITRVK